MKITAAIITNQDGLNPLLLQSLDFVDEIIIVIDSNIVSRHRERSAAIRGKDGRIKTFYRPLNNDFATQRNFAIQKATSDWILFVDDDEYVSKELAREIPLLIASGQFSAFLVKRQDVVFHQPLLYGETGHTKLIRLAKMDNGQFNRSVHEVWSVKGPVGKLSSPLYHIKDSFVSQFIGRMSSYCQIDSRILIQEGKPFSYLRLLFYPKLKFILNYFFKLGFLDGLAGFFQAYLMSIQSLTVRVFQWENKS